MLTLAVDTATDVCSVALAREGRLLAELTARIPHAHSERLIPLIDNLFRETGLAPADLELLAVTRGPGSFTGLRIGMATVKGLGLALGIEAVGVSTLQVLAHSFGGEALVCPVLNARRDQVYTGLFRCGGSLPEVLWAERAAAVEDLLAVLEQYSEPVWLCGDGTGLVLARAAETRAQLRQAPLHLLGGRAAALADLARRLPSVPVDQLTPIYLRESQAEIQLRRREAGGHES